MFKLALCLLLSHFGLDLDALPEQLQDQLLELAQRATAACWRWLLLRLARLLPRRRGSKPVAPARRRRQGRAVM